MTASSPRWQIVVGACACAAASAYVYAFDPAQGGYPQCLLYRATGLYCAGCGATRACHALLHGRLLEALHDNLFFVVLLPVALVMIIQAALPAWRDGRWPDMTLNQRDFFWRAGIIAGVALVFATLRNLPGVPFELLRPVT